MKNKKTRLVILGVIVLVLVTIGITYAYWMVTKTQSGENIVLSKCLDISFSAEANDITLSNQFPMSDEDGMKLTPYTFTVTNNCNTSVDYQIALEAIGEESKAIASNALKVAFDDSVSLLSEKVEVDTTIGDAYKSYRLGFGTLSPSGNDGSSASYKLRIWIDADASISEMNKTFKSKVSVTVGQSIIKPESDLAAKIIAMYGGVDNITTIKDFNNDLQTGLYKISDYTGDSYYFRGEIENNYVKFGTWKSSNTLSAYKFIGDEGFFESHDVSENDPMYWRIIRINGDGTIRLAYDGTTKTENGSNRYTTIGTSVYSNRATANNIIEAFSFGHSDTIIRSFLNNWYETHLKSNYDKYIADSVFCNDKTVSYREYYNPDNFMSDESSANQYYDYYRYSNTPVFTCSSEDSFTTSTTNGNGLLANPVGLLTYDDILISGATSSYEKYQSSYLYTDDVYWTLTPGQYYMYIDGSNANNGWMYSYQGMAGLGCGSSIVGSLNELSGVRPVINLKADVLFTGDGSYETPFEIIG